MLGNYKYLNKLDMKATTFLTLVMITLTFIFIFSKIGKSKSKSGTRRRKIRKRDKIKYAYHGLRCYSRGLNRAEKMVVRNLAHTLNLKKYYIFNNLMLETTEGSSTQVDHVVVSPHGIFVIETKNYSGWIFGNKKGKVWTQTLPNNKHTFQNPFRQNYKHIKTLETYLPFIHADSFKTVIVFSRRSEFKTEKPEGVVYIDQISQYIKSFNQNLINKTSFFMAIGKLSQLCQSTDISPQDHQVNLALSHSKIID